MTIIGSAYVEIRALDTNLRRDIDNAMKKIKDVTLNIKADVNLAPVRTKISELRAELRSNPLKFEVEVDDSKIVSSLADAHQLYKDNPLQVESSTDTSKMEEALQAIRERYSNMQSNVTPHVNTTRAEAEIAALDRRRTVTVPVNANTAAARAEIDLLARRRSVSVPVNANTARAAAQIDALTRRRTVRVDAKMDFLDADMKKALSALTYTMLGAVPAPAIKAGIVGVLSNIEQLSVSAAKMSTAVGSAGAAILTLGANAFSIVGDLSSVVQLAAVGPAVFSGLAITLISAKMAFTNFGKAFSSNAKTAAKALAALPTEAQAAVKELKGLWAEVSKPAQKAFWVEMGTSLQDTAHNVIPVLRDGFVSVETSLAKMATAGLRSFNSLANSGGLGAIFNNVAKGLENASKAVEPFFNAINTLSVTGSKYLPIFGDWLTKSADRFNDFITKADQAGKINVWINTAVANLKNLGSILGSSGDIIKGLVIISDMSGGKGLGQMADGMKNIADVVNGEPFKSRLIFVLEGARIGAEALGKGFGKIMDVVGRSTIALRNFLKTAGEIGGSLFDNISKIFDGTGFGDGFQLFLDSVKTSMENLAPAFRDGGKMLGDFFKIAAVVLKEMVPGINNLFDTLSKVLGKLTDGVSAVIPILNDFVQNILVVMAPIAIAVADALGKILKAFADLPGAAQNTILIFGLLLLAIRKFKNLMADTEKGEMSKFRKKFEEIGDKAKDLRTNIGSSFARIGDAFATAGAAGGYAKEALKKSFGEIGDSAKIAGSYIGDGFKKSFSQLSEAAGKLKEPLKNFSSMMGAAWKEALMPQEVRDGFKLVGQKLGDVGRIYSGYFTAAGDALKGFGKAIAGALPTSLLGPALKALPAEVGKAFGWAGEKVAAGVADVAKTIAGPAVGYAMAKMTDVVQTQSLYASKHLEGIGNGIKTAVSAIQQAPAAVGGALSKLTSAASAAFSSMQQSGAKAFNGAVLAAAVHPLTAPFVTMADSAKTAAETTMGHMSTMAKSVATSVVNATAPAREAFSGIAANASTAFANARQELSTVGSNISSTMSSAFSGISKAATTAAGVVSSTFSTAMSNVRENFAPAGSAIREAFSGIGASVAPAGTALRELGGAAGHAAGQMGLEAGRGLRSAAGGLVEALGGPFGLVIGAATTLVTIYAQSIADSKAKVDSLAQTLDQQSGAMTGATKKMLATNALDGATDKWDNFWRGMMQNSASTEETLGKLGISTQQYTDRLSDPQGRDAYLKGLDDITNALNDGVPITDEMAAAIGSTKEQLQGVTGDSMHHLAEKAGNAADELKRAEEKVRGIAAATGTSNVQAQMLSKNYETLASTTSTASSKFSALKENLDLLNRSSATNANQYKVNASADKMYQQTLADTGDSLKAIGEKTGGVFNNLYSVSKGFDMTSQAGRDLHTALDGQSDAILKIGTAAMDQALKAGKSTQDANVAAVTAMQPGVAQLRETLKGLHLEEPVIDSIIRSFGLMPDQVATAINVTGADEAQKKIFLTKLAADAYSNGNYKGVIGALPDGAFKAIADAVGQGDAYARGDYDAVLKATDNTKGGRDAAFAAILSTTNGDYKAALKGWDATAPGRSAAESAINSTISKDFSAYIKARADQGTVSSVESLLDAIVNKPRTATFLAVLDGTANIPDSIRRPSSGPGAANGAVLKSVTSQNSLLSGAFPMKMFANGGFENHVAQISQGQTPFRVWSEPESGGEAYIPLSKAKRPRSLKILEEVAKMFGYSLSKTIAFANGGLMKTIEGGRRIPSMNSKSSGGIVYAAPAATGSGPNVTMNIHPSQGLSEQQIGETAIRELYWQMQSRA